MADDTDFSLDFLCPSQEMLREVITYLIRKPSINWGGDSEAGASYFTALEDYIGMEGLDQFGRACLEDVEVWVPRTSHFFMDELADLLERFPFLIITGSFSSTYGPGRIEGNQQSFY